MNYTKGEWKVAVNTSSNTKVTARREDIRPDLAAMCPGTKDVLETLAICYGDSDQRKANARLIAAAPEMYEALKKVMPYVKVEQEAEHLTDGFGPKSNQPSDSILKQVEEALAKAEGKQC